MSYYGYHRELDSWGTASIPTKSAEELQLDAHLPSVPQEGTVVDVGAGIGLSLGASVYIRRPDLKIKSVDPGFAWLSEAELESATEDVIAFLEPDQQASLRADKEWQRVRLEGIGENLPLDDASADLVVSYSAAPEYSYDYELTFQECLRVLKLGGLALHGPMHDWVFDEWDKIIKRASAERKVSSYISRLEVIGNADNDPVSTYFTSFRRPTSKV